MHSYSGKTVFFATLHQKEEVLRPLFEKAGMKLLAAPVDTDAFGTFSGEKDRTLSVQETLRAKVRECHRLFPEETLFLASEGTFGPHPELGFLSSDLEMLLFWDRERNLEIFAEAISLSPVMETKEFSYGDDLTAFLSQSKFPEHALIARPVGSFESVVKGISSTEELEAALGKISSQASKFILQNDLRAHCHPGRRKTIYVAGEKLWEKLQSFCPDCHAPGFCIAESIPGLPCSECGEPSRFASRVVYLCQACGKRSESERADKRTHIDPGECEFCNP